MKIVVFDLDGVLVDIDSSWQLVHRAFGSNNDENLYRFVQGEIDYQEFMRSDIRLWGKVTIQQIQNILDKAPIMDTAREVVTQLKKAGIKTAIISSGISGLADRVKTMLDIDYCYANKLLVDEGGWLTGEGEETVEMTKKDIILKRLAELEGVSSKQCVVIGDSEFDVSLFKDTGLSIAFNTQNEAVKRAADLTIEEKELKQILPWILSTNLLKTNSSIEYGSIQEAHAVATSVSPDNLKLPAGLFVKSWSEDKTVKIKITCIKNVETLLATLDDLLSCIQVAEGAIKISKQTFFKE